MGFSGDGGRSMERVMVDGRWLPGGRVGGKNGNMNMVEMNCVLAR